MQWLKYPETKPEKEGWYGVILQAPAHVFRGKVRWGRRKLFYVQWEDGDFWIGDHAPPPGLITHYIEMPMWPAHPGPLPGELQAKRSGIGTRTALRKVQAALSQVPMIASMVVMPGSGVTLPKFVDSVIGELEDT
jgi:hypothetical protein